MARLFVAIDFSDSIKDQLQALQTDLHIPVDHWWTNPQLFHLTLSFIGETEKMEVVKAALADVQAPAFELRLAGVGHFFTRAEPPAQVLYAGVETQAALTGLQQQIATALAGNGFVVDTRPFLPHVTLAYMNTSDQLPIIQQFIESNQAFQTDRFTVSKFILYSSDLETVDFGHEAVFALRSV